MTHALAGNSEPPGRGGSAPAAVVLPPPPLHDVAGILRRHLMLVLGCTAVVVMVALVVSSRMAPVYEATASVRVDARQPSLPALDALQGIANANANELTTEIGELESATLASAVADSLSLRVVVTSPDRAPRSRLVTAMDAGRGSDSGVYRFEPDGGRVRVVNAASGALVGVFAPGQRVTLGSARLVPAPAALARSFAVTVLPFEGAVAAMQKELAVTRQAPEANIIEVRYRNGDPVLARDVANALVSQFIARRQSVQQTAARSTAAFLRTQLARLSRQLTSSEDALRAFRERRHIVDLPQQGQSAVLHTADMKAQRDMLDAERIALGALLDDVHVRTPVDTSSTAESPYRNLVAFPTLLRNQAAASLLTALNDAEDRRSQLLTRRTMRDPDVQVLTDRIRQIEDQLRGISVTYLQGLSNQVTSLDGVLAQSRQQMERFPADEITLARLERQSKSYEDIYTLLQTRLKEAEVAEAVQDASVRVVDLATTPPRPIRPKPLLNLSLALLSGLLLGGAVAFVRERSDRAIHSRSELQAVVGMAVLGLIPQFHGKMRLPGGLRGLARRIGGSGSKRPAPAELARTGGARGVVTALSVGNDIEVRLMAEAFQRLATNIAFSRQDRPLRRLVLTSPMPGDGKTMVSVNLASALAQRGLRVLLVDGDLRRGMVSTLFAVPREPGLSDVLLRGAAVADVCREVRVAGGATLHVLTTGALQNNPAPALVPGHVRPLLDAVDAAYDLVIIDSPPINVVTDAALFASNCDGVLLVARAGVTPLPALVLSMEQLRQICAPVVGAVLNDIDFERDATYDSAYRYYGHSVSYDTRAVN